MTVAAVLGPALLTGAGVVLPNAGAAARSAWIPAGDTTFGPMTIPWWNTYCEYLMQLVGTGKITLGAINFAVRANGRTVDVINGASDPRIPMIKPVAQAIKNAA
jgi:hypothetical protein